VVLAAGLFGLARGPAAAPPGVPAGPNTRILIDEALGESTVQITRIDEASVWFRPAREPASTLARQRPTSEIIALISADPAWRPRRDPVDERPLLSVLLTDGQRVVGRVAREPKGAIAGSASAKDAPLTLETPLGIVRVPLDMVSSVGVGRPTSMTVEPPRKDSVTLSNGDVLDGFVESVGSAVVVQPDGAPSATVPLDRVGEIHLANPRIPARGPRAWFADGSVVTISGLIQAADSLPAARIPLLGRDAPTPLARLGSVVFDSSRVVGLSTLTPDRFTPSADRRWSRPPRALPGPAPLDAPDLELPGPMVVDWALPDGAARVSGVAELARFTEDWGECSITIELVAEGATSALWSRRLDGAGASGAFNVSLGSAAPDRRLRITLGAGSRGPIQDRVILRRPLLLLHEPR